MSVPKCRECEDRLRMGSILTGIEHRCYGEDRVRRYHDTICDGDELPKASPKWCPKRKEAALEGDVQDA